MHCTFQSYFFAAVVSIVSATSIYGDDLPSFLSPIPASAVSLGSEAAAVANQLVWLPNEEKLRTVSSTSYERTHRPREHRLLFDVGFSFLRPYLSGTRSSAGATGGKWVDPQYETGIRYQMAYQCASDIGIRGRYFELYGDVGLAGNFGAGSVGVDVQTADFELTLTEQMNNWDLVMSAGVQYGKLEFAGDGVVVFPGTFSFEGFGPTFAVEGQRRIGDSGLTLFANARGSLLLGEISNDQPVPGLAQGSVEDEITLLLDAQMGCKWLVLDEKRYQVEIRFAWETQFWLNDTFADDVYGIGSNLALSGPALTAELRY